MLLNDSLESMQAADNAAAKVHSNFKAQTALICCSHAVL